MVKCRTQSWHGVCLQFIKNRKCLIMKFETREMYFYLNEGIKVFHY